MIGKVWHNLQPTTYNLQPTTYNLQHEGRQVARYTDERLMCLKGVVRGWKVITTRPDICLSTPRVFLCFEPSSS
ncbi:hypothetical protein GOX01_24250 [Gluconobacter oxydans]|nr:hypothetical protein GOX01_24250 [Gluconobacter oxydans]